MPVSRTPTCYPLPRTGRILNDARMSKRPTPPTSPDHGRILSDSDECLDSVQLHQLEERFRHWADSARRTDVILSRRRILLLFLIIRYTGAKLHEALNLEPLRDIDLDVPVVRLGEDQPRAVPLSGTLAAEIRTLTTTPDGQALTGLNVDPAFVRRKFYEQAEACGFPKNLGSPEMIRKSRGVELMRSNMPLPAVQKYLGHSSPNLTSSYVTFSETEIRDLTSSFIEQESNRSSARNTFFGKISNILRSDIQAIVEVTTLDGHCISSIITRDSLTRLGLKKGRLATVEVKAPWVSLYTADDEPQCSAENRLQGTVVHITRGSVTTEYVVRIDAGPELCIIAGTESLRRLRVQEQDRVWALFGNYATILRVP